MPIHVNALLAPLSDASPCGEDMLFSSEFDAIQHARKFDDPSLDQGEWITEIKEADWGFVVDQSVELLGTQTKDLRLAVWLTEALAIQDGIAGLTQGYELLAGLCATWWEQVHPLPEGDDTEYRLGNVGWLSGRTAELLRAIPLTDGSGSAYTALDWDVAQHVAQAVRRDPDNANEIARNKPSVDQIEASKRMTSVAFYASLLAGLSAFAVALDALDDELERRAGNAAPSFRQARDAYESVRMLAERFAREQGYAPDAQPVAVPQATSQATQIERNEPSFKTPFNPEPNAAMPAAQTPPVPTTAAPVMPTVIAGLQNRAQAVEQLRAVAKYFRATEPHSPVAYLADKAAEWADMPLHQWLASVVKDDGSLSHIRELLGLKPDENN
ncbi:type VI secretion system protein TssA [Burkholderia sp. Ac-20379]|uniref:type VI secretion system protein TssA n=1 Tax=Burkholderia sp. Ac-20379 TaxID=2703900 RepID=UPI001981E566|nr:type VI secretion system protein TssA [Burkholderia sp. Ac-20379]MBN3723394.1 type VI secretion system protein TssA [Burkholderia sp. Ac-20379]